MTNLTQDQIEELEDFWNDSDKVSIALVSADELAHIGHLFKPSPDEGGIHKPGMRKAIDSAAERRVKVLSDSIHKTLCVQWRYCERRAAFSGEGIQLCLAVADGLLSAVTQIPIPVTALSVYLVRRGLLDAICQCSKSTP